MSIEKANSLTVLVRGNECQSSGKIEVIRWDSRSRLMRAIKFSLFSLLGTALAVLIPGLHFILVPLGLLITLVLPFIIYGRAGKINGGLASCPYCDKEFPIASRPERYPFDEICNFCHRHMTIELEPT